MTIYIYMDLNAKNQKLWKDAFPEDLIYYKNDVRNDSDYASIDIVVGNISPDKILKIQNLQLIQTDSAGFDNYLSLDWRTLEKKGVQLGNMGGFYSLSVAEDTICGVLTLLRNIPSILDLQRLKQWQAQILRDQKKNLTEKKVAIMGFGNIGKEIARLLQPYHCKIMIISSKDSREKLLDVARLSDIFILTIPYLENNKNIIDRDILNALGPNGIFVNVGRGGTVDEAALEELLRNQKLAGAYLDVTLEEPIGKDSPLWDVPNLLLSQHGAGGMENESEEKTKFLIESINYFKRNKTPMKSVDMLAYCKSEQP